MPRPERATQKGEKSVRAEQIVSEMVAEALVHQAEALSEGTGWSFEEAFAEVLEAPAGRRLVELADGPHRLERAADWQVGLLGARKSRRPARLRASEEAGTRSSKALLIQPPRSLVSRDLMREG
jgi:hypothetical protein